MSDEEEDRERVERREKRIEEKKMRNKTDFTTTVTHNSQKLISLLNFAIRIRAYKNKNYRNSQDIMEYV